MSAKNLDKIIDKLISEINSDSFEKMPKSVAEKKKSDLERLKKERAALDCRPSNKKSDLYIIKDEVVYFNKAIVGGVPILYGNMDLFENALSTHPLKLFYQVPISILPEAETVEQQIAIYKKQLNDRERN